MSFIPRTHARPTKPEGVPILSVGRRAYVNCRGRVALAHDDGRPSEHTLADGAEVEIMAWRPRGAGGGTRYRVQARAGGHEGWLAADALRKTAAPVAQPVTPQPTPAPPRPVARDGHRKFGQR